MGLFDAFSSSDENQQFQQGNQAYNQYAGQAQNKITKSTRRGIGALKEGKTEGLGYLDTGANQASGFYDQAAQPYQGLMDRGNAGLDLYGNLLGLGGADMQGTLEGIPGYQFAMNQGLEGLNRAAAGRGMLQSGNNTQDILRFSQGLADQNYFNYLNATQPYFGLAQGAASGLAGVRMGQGNIYDRLGQNKSNVATGTAANIANLHQAEGQNVAGILQGQGQNASDMYMNQANAGSAADANMWGAILGLANAGASAYGA